MKDEKESTLRTNPWKTGTIVLGILCIFLIVFNVLEVNSEMEEEKVRICNLINKTPAWVSSHGKIIGYGVITIKESSREFSNNLTKMLIENRIKFVYNKYCSACQLQISIFGQENFNKLNQKGLAVDCSKFRS